MAATTRRQPSQFTQQRISLLRHLALSSLPASAPTALFFAERLLALDHNKEESAYLIALTLAANNRCNEAIWALRQPVSFNPVIDDHNNNPSTSYPVPRRWPNSKLLSKPAVEVSIRCARLYAQQCLVVGRGKEGRDALAQVLVPGTPLAPSSHDSFDPTPSTSYRDTEPWVCDLELGRLARKAGEHDRAIVSFRRVLEHNPWCWEALEALCALGHPPDPDLLFPSNPRSAAAFHARTAPASPVETRSRPLAPPTHPPPLGPSQTSAVNSAVPFVLPKARATIGAPANGGLSDGLGLYTPNDAGVAVGGQGKMLGDGKRLFALVAGGIWKKPGLPAPRGVDEMSMDDSASFDTSFYPTSYAPPALSSFPTGSQNAQNAQTHASSSSSLFTPPATSTLSAAVVPGMKRARGQQLVTASSTSMTESEDLKPGRRVMRGVPGAEKKEKRDSSASAPTRRSSRLSRDTNTSSNGLTSNGPSSTSMAVSRSQTSRNGTAISGPTLTARDKKRSKNGAGPSVLSDAGSDALSPPSHSSSPVPSSPGASNQMNPVDPAVQDAEDYVVMTLRYFGRAAVAASRYEGAKAIDALGALPIEQQKSWRCLIGLGRAHLEMLNYDKAEKAFAQARTLAPHLLDSMELYSTLLWHLRLPTALSFLAQDLMAIAPRSSSSWIASGNVFSHLEDHAAALKCFKRAAQIDGQCVYAYTLSGHECVVLEEWERALGFFREAVKLDPRHYNAWFGLGNVYMQTGKFRLAEYYFRKAAEINPRNATLVCCVGSVLEKLGRRKEALDLYEKACQLAPESPAVRFKRVKILVSLKQYKVAEADLLALKDKAPNEFNVYFLLGKLYKMLGNRTEMVKNFALAQDLEPRTAALIRETIQSEVAGKNGEMDIDESGDSGSMVF